ncbi:O-antigen ligase family protein [Caminibacter mediatlanticus]|uniref:O-antigen polymerase n=1 Tax=Caminibacter mediatlanticus TB-2 TaxID=391592 RepID=A0AAI9AGJ8_9BACT|nr:O-antigen ligase family protein [Caminibacter mediatlanticus]EDM23221.1 O-antigen polymerase [Caminibacter mediatlanticus TB-2]
MLKKTNINSVLNYFILLLIFVSLFSTAAIRIVLGLIFILWILENNFQIKFSILKQYIKHSWPLKLLLIFFTIKFFSIFWSNSIYNGFWSGYFKNAYDSFFRHDLLYLLIIPIILTSFKKNNAKKAIDIFLLGMFISEIFSYLLFFDLLPHWNFIRGTPYNPSPFLNHSLYSFLLVIFIFTLFEKFQRTNILIEKLIFLFFSITATINLFINGGRTGQLIFIFTVFFYAFYKYPKKIKYVVSGILAIIVIFTLAYKFSPIFNQRINNALYEVRGIVNGNYSSSWGGRFLSILVTKDVFEKNPILGIGIGNSRKEVFEIIKSNYPNAFDYYKRRLHSDMHNEYAQILVEEGIIGLIIFIMFLFISFKQKINDGFYNFFIKLFIFVFTLALFTGNFFSKMFTSFVLFYIFFAISVKLSTYHETNNTEKDIS